MENFGQILLYVAMPNLNECTFLPCSEIPMHGFNDQPFDVLN